MLRFLSASLLLLVAVPLFAADKPLIMISLRCCEGDPMGTLENGKLKVLSAPKVVTVSGQTAKFVVGGAKPLIDEDVALVDFGLICELKPTLRKDGKVLLEVNFTATELVESDSPDQVSAIGTALRSASLAKPGEMKILGRRGEGDKQQWLEATIELVKEGDIKPAKAAQAEPDAIPVEEVRTYSTPAIPKLPKGQRISGPFGRGK